MFARLSCVIVLAVLLAPILAFGQTNDKPKIAVLPVLNNTQEKWQELKDRQVDRANKFIADEFPSRGFELISGDVVVKALDEVKLDLKDEETWTKANLYKTGEKLGVDYVLFAVIVDTGQKTTQSLVSAKKEGWATFKVWLVDVKKQQAILSAQTIKGSSGGGFFAGLDKGSERQVIAVANGLRDALKDFFRGFPKNKKKS